jgi:hypothetical protein
MMKEQRNVAGELFQAIKNEKTAYTPEQSEYLNQFPVATLDREDFDIDTVLETVKSPKINSESDTNNKEDDFDENEGWFGNTNRDVGIKEISLYDHTLTKEENFTNSDDKFVLFKVTKDGEFGVSDKVNVIPCPQTKCVINTSTLELAEEFNVMPVSYNSFMGVDVLNFMKYNSNFFTCDERVFFITLLVKFKCFDFKPFYWSKEKIFHEVGIKKDRANKIIKKFVELGFLSMELVKTKIDGRPMQINYFDIDGGKLIDLLPQILHSNEDEDGYVYTQPDIEKYLKPSINKESKSISSIMQ